MICKTCGTEIADKALICYRCGTPTSSPARPVPPPPVRRRSAARNLLAVVTLLVLIFAALFMGWAGRYEVPPAIAYGVAALAALVLVIRIVRRRRVR
jgi:hypothetical protein